MSADSQSTSRGPASSTTTFEAWGSPWVITIRRWSAQTSSTGRSKWTSSARTLCACSRSKRRAGSPYGPVGHAWPTTSSAKVSWRRPGRKPASHRHVAPRPQWSVELHDLLQHGGSIVRGPKLAVLARPCSRQIGVHHHRVSLVETRHHLPVHADEWRDHEVETGLLTESPCRAERAVEAIERGVRRANRRRELVRTKIVDRDKPRIAVTRNGMPMVAPEPDRLVDEVDRFEVPACSERGHDGLVGEIVRLREHRTQPTWPRPSKAAPYRGGRPLRFVRRRFASRWGSARTVPAVVASTSATRAFDFEMRSNHSSLLSRHTPTTEPWHTFWHLTSCTSPTLASAHDKFVVAVRLATVLALAHIDSGGEGHRRRVTRPCGNRFSATSPSRCRCSCSIVA